MAANAFYNAEKTAAVAVGLIVEDMLLGSTINRDFAAEFGGGSGDTVNVRIPAALKARTKNISDKTTAITLDALNERSVPVQLTTHAYSAVDLSEEDLNLNLTDFGRQVLAPQSLAIAEYIEDAVVTAMQATPESFEYAYSAADPGRLFVNVRKGLRDRAIPQSNLYAAVGTQIFADLLAASALTDVSQSGSTAALREAQIGRLRGFTVIESNRLDEDEAVFYHRDAFTLVVRAPKVPEGARAGASVSAGGFAARHLMDYDASVLADRSVVSTFVGCQDMPLARPSQVTGDGLTVDVIGAIRVDTSTAASS